MFGHIASNKCITYVYRGNGGSIEAAAVLKVRNEAKYKQVNAPVVSLPVVSAPHLSPPPALPCTSPVA